MDGLPKNKKPWGKAEAPKQIGLDNYLFERKLQEVYDQKPVSNDLPSVLRSIRAKLHASKSKRLAKKQQRATTGAQVKKNKHKLLIDAPHVSKKRFKSAGEETSAPRTTKLKRNKLKLELRKQHVIVIGVALVLSGSAYGIMQVDGSKKPKATDTPEVMGATSAQKPDFDPLTPKENPNTAVKFDPTKRVASFQDKIQGFPVVVSQQKLGETELKDADFLRRTATNFNLKTEVTTHKGQAFIGVNIDKNTQFVMFIYRDFLFFIQAETTFKNQVIVDYIDALQ